MKMKFKWILCPACREVGKETKLFKMNEDTRIEGSGIEQKCRKCKYLILTTGDGESTITL